MKFDYNTHKKNNSNNKMESLYDNYLLNPQISANPTNSIDSNSSKLYSLYSIFFTDTSLNSYIVTLDFLKKSFENISCNRVQEIDLSNISEYDLLITEVSCVETKVKRYTATYEKYRELKKFIGSQQNYVDREYITKRIEHILQDSIEMKEIKKTNFEDKWKDVWENDDYMSVSDFTEEMEEEKIIEMDNSYGLDTSDDDLDDKNQVNDYHDFDFDKFDDIQCDVSYDINEILNADLNDDLTIYGDYDDKFDNKSGHQIENDYGKALEKLNDEYIDLDNKYRDLEIDYAVEKFNRKQLEIQYLDNLEEEKELIINEYEDKLEDLRKSFKYKLSILCEEHDNELKNLRNSSDIKLDELREDYEDTIDDILEEHVMEVDYLEKELSFSRKDCVMMELQNSFLIKNCEKLEECLKVGEFEKHRAVKDLEDYLKKIKYFESKISEDNNKINYLQEMLDSELEYYNKERPKYENEITCLKNKLKELEFLKSSSEDHMEFIKTQLEKLEKECDKANSEKNIINVLNNELEKKCDELKSDYIHLEELNNKLMEENKSLNTRFEAVTKENKIVIDKLNRLLKENNNLINIRNEHNNLKNINSSLELQLITISNEMNDLKNIKSSLELQLQTESNKLSERIIDLEMKIIDMDYSSSLRESENKTKFEELLNKHDNEIKLKNKIIDEMEKTLESHLNNIKELKYTNNNLMTSNVNNINAINSTRSMVKKFEDYCEKLLEDINELEEEKTHLVEKLESKDSTIQMLKDSCEKLLEKINELEKEKRENEIEKETVENATKELMENVIKFNEEVRCEMTKKEEELFELKKKLGKNL